ncbi:MAG: hypothetical protein WA790_00660 [Sulfitobacter sp.]
MDFSFEDFAWQATVQLSAWSEFTLASSIPLIFAPEDRDDTPLSIEEITLAEWVIKNQTIQKSILLDAVLKAYPEFRQQFFDDYDIEDNETDLPIITSTGNLPKVLMLQEVFVHQISKGDAPYVGYQFSCAWDDEHGLGVLMHNDRIVEIGGADTAYTLWVAEGDLKGEK